MASNSLKFSLAISAVDKASSVLKGVVGAFGAVAKAGEGLKKAGETMRIARENVDDFTGRMKAGLQSVLAPAQTVEDALARLAASRGPDIEDLEQTLAQARTGALEWSRAHTQSAATYVDAMAAAMSAGFDGASAIAGTETALRVATATGSDATAVATTLGQVYTQMGDRSADAAVEVARLGDMLVRAAQHANANVAAMATPMKAAAPAAKAAGVPLEQLVATLGSLSAAGIEGGAAGSSLAAMLRGLDGASQQLGFSIARSADGGIDLVATLAALEEQFGSVDRMAPELAAQLEEAFGPAAFMAINALLGQSEAVGSSFVLLRDSAGAAAAAQAVIEGTSSSALKTAQNQIDALKIELSAGIVPAILALATAFTPVLEALAKLAQAHPGIVGTAGGLAAMAVAAGSVIGPLLSLGGAFSSVAGMLLSADGALVKFAGKLVATYLPAMGSAIASAWAWTAAMLANPITWIVLAIVAAVALIYIYWEPISEFFVELWDTVSEAFGAAWDAVVAAWDAAVAWFQGLFGGIRDAFKESFIGGLIKLFTTFSPIAIIAKAFSAILPWLIRFWGTVLDTVVAALKALPGLIADAAVWVFDAAVAGFKALLDFYVGFWSWVWDIFKAGVSLVVDGVLAYFRNLWTGIKLVVGFIVDAVRGVVDFFASGLKNDLARVMGFVDGVWDRITSAVDGGVAGVLSLLAEFNPVVLIAKGFNAVAEWLFGFSLLDAGRNIVRTVVDGIKSMASAPVDAMRSVVGRVRDLLPFSPAKEGPLRDLHRVKLVETVAESVQPAPLVDAMAGVAGAAMGALESVPTPMIMPTPRMPLASSAAGAAGGGQAPNVSVQIYVGAGTSSSVVEELEAWIRNPKNAGRLAAAVQRAQARDARAEFG